MEEIAPLLPRTLVLVAHPDDEAVGCGTLLQRMRNSLVIFATDGAPRDEYFWGKYGSREAYAELRRQEARLVMGLAGVQRIEFLNADGEYFLDQALFRSLSSAFESLSGIIERETPQALLTLAYEGGHPDHDTCSFLASVLARRYSLPNWEFPLYFRSDDGSTDFQQHFRMTNGHELIVHPTPVEEQTKRRMLEAYRSQGEILKNFSSAVEWFRPQEKYDYSQAPHAGPLNYENWGWPMKGADVCAAFTEFLRSREAALAQRKAS